MTATPSAVRDGDIFQFDIGRLFWVCFAKMCEVLCNVRANRRNKAARVWIRPTLIESETACNAFTSYTDKNSVNLEQFKVNEGQKRLLIN